MSVARDVILARIRDALGHDRDVPTIARDYDTTSHLEGPQVVDRFAEVVDDYRATVHRCDRDGLPAALAGIVAASAAQRIAIPTGLPDGWLTHLSEDDVEVVRDTPAPSTDPDAGTASGTAGLTPEELDTIDVVITGSAVAIADTGTIVLDASDDQGRRALTLVPDHHVCVVTTDRIVATVPQALARLDPRRPLTMISGPSATSDIELDRVEGVHGPRTLDVVIVD